MSEPEPDGMSLEDLQALAGITAMAEARDWVGRGKLTREALDEALDALWAAGRFPEATLWPDEAIIAACEDALYCGAVLFPLPGNAWREAVLAAGEPVHPDAIPYLRPVQGPQPARCLLDKDHAIGWHWSNGTWWKA